MAPSAIRDPRTIANIRYVYAVELEALAAQLRPRFESGELRACTQDELEDGQARAGSPHWRIEEAVRERFGLRVKATQEDGAEFTEADAVAAHVILAVSPSAAPLEAEGWLHVANWAVSAAGWDVLLYARAKGWSKPVAGEQIYRSPWEELKATGTDPGVN